MQMSHMYFFGNMGGLNFLTTCEGGLRFFAAFEEGSSNMCIRENLNYFNPSIGY